jgi:N-acetylmuramoyl-L-alanine amidase
MSVIRKIVIHCTDSPDNVDIGVKEIFRWHTMPPPQGRGWSDIAYHEVVRRDGTIEVGRFENGDSILEGKEIGAHVKGHNSDSLGICWVGKIHMTKAQRTSLLRLVSHKRKLHGIPVENVLGHYELAPGKTCPNIDMDDFRKSLVEFEASAAA